MLLEFESGAERKFPFCVYGLGRFRFRYLECVWCVGAGRNLVRISLGFSVVLLPRSALFPPGSLGALHGAGYRWIGHARSGWAASLDAQPPDCLSRGNMCVLCCRRIGVLSL